MERKDALISCGNYLLKEFFEPETISEEETMVYSILKQRYNFTKMELICEMFGMTESEFVSRHWGR